MLGLRAGKAGGFKSPSLTVLATRLSPTPWINLGSPVKRSIPLSTSTSSARGAGLPVADAPSQDSNSSDNDF